VQPAVLWVELVEGIDRHRGLYRVETPSYVEADGPVAAATASNEPELLEGLDLDRKHIAYTAREVPVVAVRRAQVVARAPDRTEALVLKHQRESIAAAMHPVPGP
jgi:hypothetical protein